LSCFVNFCQFFADGHFPSDGPYRHRAAATAVVRTRSSSGGSSKANSFASSGGSVSRYSLVNWIRSYGNNVLACDSNARSDMAGRMKVIGALMMLTQAVYGGAAKF
jgi:hypothetical protein